MKTDMILHFVFVLEQSSTIFALLRFILSMHTLNMLFQISLHNKYDNWKAQRWGFVRMISSKCYVCPSFVLFVHFDSVMNDAIRIKKIPCSWKLVANQTHKTGTIVQLSNTNYCCICIHIQSEWNNLIGRLTTHIICTKRRYSDSDSDIFEWSLPDLTEQDWDHLV